MSYRRFLFPWFCRRMGAIFLAESNDVVDICPICGELPEDKEDGNAFESGHLRRIFGEEFGIK